jgi:hypothetical protein
LCFQTCIIICCIFMSAKFCSQPGFPVGVSHSID